MFKRFVLVTMLAFGCCSQVLATDKMYGVISGGYTDSEFDLTKADGASYKFAVGYQFHRQWYLELGYQQLADDDLATQLPETLLQVESFEPGLQGDALFAAFLGKAANNMGELFYRVGVLKADMKGQGLIPQGNCEIGAGSDFSLATGENYTLCRYDDSNVAAVLGIGFDFFVSARGMVRFELEHIRGENDLAINAAYLGLRYNF